MSLSVVQLATKRLLFLVSAIVIAGIVPELIDKDGFQWAQVWELSKAPLAYWLITVFRDYRDPSLPTLTPEPAKPAPIKIPVIDLNIDPNIKLSNKG